MDFDKLVDSILNEIYRRIGEINIPGNTKKAAIVLWDNNKENYNEISHAFSIRSFEERKEGYDIIIIPSLCLRGLASLAKGINVSDEERFILTSIMRGKTVYVLEDGIEFKRYKDTAPKTLYNKYLDYERQIKAYGIKIIGNLRDVLRDINEFDPQVKVNDSSQLIKNHPYLSKDDKTSQVMWGQTFDNNTIISKTGETKDLTNKKLISESDINRLYTQGVKAISIRKSCIITPLADDYIRTHHIVINKI